MIEGKFSAAEVTAMVDGARAVNRHDVAVALQAMLISARYSQPGDFTAAAVIDIIADAAIRSVQMPHDPQRLERKSLTA